VFLIFILLHAKIPTSQHAFTSRSLLGALDLSGGWAGLKAEAVFEMWEILKKRSEILIVIFQGDTVLKSDYS
jgi:hypothetical protein